MIKRIAGIATILLVILMIGIGIARADTRVSRFDRLDLRGYSLNHFSEAELCLRNTRLHLASNLDSVDNLRLSPVVEVSRRDALRDVRDLNLDADRVRFDLELHDLSV